MADTRQQIRQAEEDAKAANEQAYAAKKEADKLKKTIDKNSTKGDPTKASTAQLITGEY